LEKYFFDCHLWTFCDFFIRPLKPTKRSTITIIQPFFSMKNRILLSGLTLLLTAIFFTACLKEDNLQNSVLADTAKVSVQAGVTSPDIATSRTIFFPGGIFGPLGLRLGCSSYTGECLPGHCMFCNMTGFPPPIDKFTMAGPGYATNPETVYLDMNGSALAPDFLQSLQAGVYNLGEDFLVPQDIVDGIYAANGLPAPVGPTIFTQGDKQVLNEPGTSTIVIPVLYGNGGNALWSIIIHHP
jgi:hypothetical protein